MTPDYSSVDDVLRLRRGVAERWREASSATLSGLDLDAFEDMQRIEDHLRYQVLLAIAEGAAHPALLAMAATRVVEPGE